MVWACLCFVYSHLFHFAQLSDYFPIYDLPTMLGFESYMVFAVLFGVWETFTFIHPR